MAVCCICKIAPGTLKIKDGNPKYKGKPVCKECEGYRKLLRETKYFDYICSKLSTKMLILTNF